ncbi:MAG TPA: NAD(P)/FAD-dependent oxidoreductase, partial [Acidimicrobiales bacterium]|nr:NAD(P)/FAD-dependent oxidoreductase [Acidimicrobiales bacterium]
MSDAGNEEQVDAIVLGLGPGGEEVAGKLAEAGLSVVAIDGGLVGGECPYWGCIPSKMMIRAANLLTEGRRIPGMAGASTVTADWGPVARRIREEATDNWDDKVAVERLEGKGARFVRGWGRLDGPNRVVVGDRRFSARRAVVVGTGAKAWAPPVPGLAGTPYWSNREAVEADRLPDSLLVLGGGAIGVELAQVFARFGVAVTVVEVAPRLLAAEEPESSRQVADTFADEGIAVRAGADIEQVDYTAREGTGGPDGGEFVLRLEGGEVVSGARLLVAAGRRPDLGSIAAGTVGVDEQARALPVDDHLRVAPGVWAVGDVTGQGAFTHVSMYQA